jgi:hypothetical protein
MTADDQHKRTERARSGRWAIARSGEDAYQVTNRSAERSRRSLDNGGTSYSVTQGEDGWACTCKDNQRRGGRCKHVEAVRLFLQGEPLDVTIIDPDSTHHQEARMSQQEVPPWDEIKKQLAAPFHSYYVGWKAQATNRDKTRALAVAYIDARTVMDRLDHVVGPGNWSDTYRLVSAGDGEFAIECTLALFGVSKSDIGTADEDDDGSQASLSKSAYSDALKRAAVKWGIGRYLYRLPKVWVGYDAARKQLTEMPELPAWALPEAERDSGPGNGRSTAHRGNGNGRGDGTSATPHPAETRPELEKARAVVLPFGTRSHPEYKGKTLGEVSGLNGELIAWLANEFAPTSDGGRTVQSAAQVIAEYAKAA